MWEIWLSLCRGGAGRAWWSCTVLALTSPEVCWTVINCGFFAYPLKYGLLIFQ
jgi:hypothetical protein